MNHEPDIGARRLLHTVSGVYPHPHSLPFDPDSPIADALAELEYTDPVVFIRGDSENIRTLRARVRYLACLWPDEELNNLANRIHALINNQLFTIADIRLVLQGRSLIDPTKRTNEVPLSSLQTIGKLLRQARPLREIAREARVAYGTVESIERYLGIRTAAKDRLMDTAIEAARSGMSVKGFARKYNLPKTSAHRIIHHARDVLRELGETK